MKKKRKFTTVFITLLCILAIGVSTFALYTTLKPDTSAGNNVTQGTDDGAGNGGDEIPVIPQSNGFSMPKMMRFSMPSVQSEEPEEQDGILLNAIVTPDNVVDKTVDWTVAWSNPDTEWATGKTVTDYVTVTPTEDGSLSAYVKCLQPFGTPIFVTVTSRVNAEKSATCQVDYMKRAESLKYLVSEYNEIYKYWTPYYTLMFNEETSDVQTIDISHAGTPNQISPSTTVQSWGVGTIESAVSFKLESILSDGLIEQYKNFNVNYYDQPINEFASTPDSPFGPFLLNKYKIETAFDVPTHSWGDELYNALENNTDSYDFKLVLTITYSETGLVETREILFKVNPDSIIEIENVELPDDNIII
ncbi:MAG: hypothetical protein J6R83_00725 [Clostridia bacterium]|nr:hypothetical protein [Clostridia bacterium]